MNRIGLTISVAIFTLTMSSLAFGNNYIKKPNVSGKFYTADAKQLKKNIATFYSASGIEPLKEHVEVIIAPHAGYVFSGPIAAHSFKAASGGNYQTIVILAPSHYHHFKGMSLWPKGGFETPLGVVEVDEPFAAKLMEGNELIHHESKYYDREHSLEVELPFIKYSFPNAKIVPIIMGMINGEDMMNFARQLHGLVGERDDVLVVVSSDMSHFHDYDAARKLDLAALENIKSLDVGRIVKGQESGETEIDGIIPVVTSALYANLRGLTAVHSHYANSGDTAGDKSRVVGYTSLVFAKEPNQPRSESALNDEQKKRLLTIARKTLEAYVRDGKRLEFAEKDQRLHAPEGAFVTLHKGPNHNLRGCIGHVIGDQPLHTTVRDMTIASATQDPRFSSVTEEELDEIEIEISVLSVPKRVKSADEIELGVHGVIVGEGANRGLFLPQVATETGWSKERFLSELCSQKAGLNPDAWKDPNTKLEVFTADIFEEKEYSK